MSHDRKKIPSSLTKGPPELAAKKAKDLQKTRWKTIQIALSEPKRYTIAIDILKTYGWKELKAIAPKLFFEESNNQLFDSTTAWRVTGPKKELKKFLTGDPINMEAKAIVNVYTELK